VSKRLDAPTGDKLILFNQVFNANQEAHVTLTTIDAQGAEIGVLLKGQSTTYTSGVVDVLYVPASKVIQVWTYTPSQSWLQRGADIPVTLLAGDKLGARATDTGSVLVYRNGVLLGTRDITAWPYYRNGGRVGFAVLNAAATVADDFGGGNLALRAANAITRVYVPIMER
jgi:hypothetical protein